jgi:hypothetical protein
LNNSAWADEKVRVAVRAKAQVDRATEELVRLATEWRRLRSWIVDREEYIQDLIEKKCDEHEKNPDGDHLIMAVALKRRLEALRLDHRRILVGLDNCKFDLMVSDVAKLEDTNPTRRTDLQHLPEMNAFNLRKLAEESPAPSHFPSLDHANLRSFTKYALDETTTEATDPKDVGADEADGDVEGEEC